MGLANVWTFFNCFLITGIATKDEPHYAGREGVVTHIDGAGQIHGTWGGCAIVPEIDTFTTIVSSK